MCLLLLAVPVVSTSDAAGAVTPTREIPQWWGAAFTPEYVGAPAKPAPVDTDPLPPNPHMASTAAANVHGDSQASDTHRHGPLGREPTVRSAMLGPFPTLCGPVAFTRAANLIVICANLSGVSLLAMDPQTLDVLARTRLGQRDATVAAILSLDLRKVFDDVSGGAYGFLDELDRFVVAGPTQVIHVLSLAEAPDGWRFVEERSYDLNPHLERDCKSLANLHPTDRCDTVIAVAPDWEGRYWFVSHFGVVGVVDPRTGAVRTLELPEGEEVANGLAAGPDGVFAVTTHALYGLEATPDGRPTVLWREPYDRGSRRKPSGALSWGSGTTPTLLGDDLVAITDNADPQIHVLFVDRRRTVEGARTLCRVPVFGSGASATDNSLIGVGNSVVVENNFGYQTFLDLLLGRSVRGGLARVDIAPDRKSCRVVWNSNERAPSSVAKMALQEGPVYAYTKDPDFLVDAWYLTAIDFHTGRTLWKRRAGLGPSFDNMWSAITLGPDASAFVGVLAGIVRISDTT